MVSDGFPAQPTHHTSLGRLYQTLKRAHFILPYLAPISTLNSPSTPSLNDEKRSIEEKETERQKRIVRGNSIGPNDTEEWWTLDKVESFYRECCASRRGPSSRSLDQFKWASTTKPSSLDPSEVQLTPTTAGILSDLFNIEWGPHKPTSRERDPDEPELKPMLHTLLIPGAPSIFRLHLIVDSNHPRSNSSEHMHRRP